MRTIVVVYSLQTNRWLFVYSFRFSMIIQYAGRNYSSTVQFEMYKLWLLVPSYTKLVIPEDHRVDSGHQIVNTQIQHLFDDRAVADSRRSKVSGHCSPIPAMFAFLRFRTV